MSGHIDHALWKAREGQVFNLLTVLGRTTAYGRGCAQCRCVCGKIVPVHYGQLIRWRVKSCGCKHDELGAKTRTTHGLTGTRQYHLWVTARARAKAENLLFDIEISDVQIPKCCPVFGITLDTDQARGHKQRSDSAPSLDKIVPRLGYVKGNVQVISWRANQLKSNMTANEARKIALYLETYGSSTV